MPFGRRRFRIALKGTGIHISSEGFDEPIVGFRAIRFVRAKSAEEARTIAVAKIRNEWFSSAFCSANRAQAPVITVDSVEWVRNPFRRSRPNRGYDFFRGVGRAGSDQEATRSAGRERPPGMRIMEGEKAQEDAAV